MMIQTGEQARDASLSVQEALLELSTPAQNRTRIVVERDLPSSFSFPSDILAYGDDLTTRGVQLLETTGEHTESLFLVGIDPGRNEFMRVTSASRPKRSRTSIDAEGLVGISPGLGLRDTYLPIIGRMLGAIVRRQKFANVAALEAHTHPPTVRARFAARGLTEEQAERLQVPLNVAPPSSPDVWKLTRKGWNLGSLVFSPGGLAFLMVPTDKTPKQNRAELDAQVAAGDPFAHEVFSLQNDYVAALSDGVISSRLENILREMYSGRFPANVAVDVLWRHNLRYVLSGEPHAVLFNPVVYSQMTHLKHELEHLHCVGYYYLPGGSDYTFSRFTSWPDEQ